MESYVKRENQKQKKNNKNSFSKRFFLFTSSKGLHVLKKRVMEKEVGGGGDRIFPQIQVFMDLQVTTLHWLDTLNPCRNRVELGTQMTTIVHNRGSFKF
jgi:hypothetical protein